VNLSVPKVTEWGCEEFFAWVDVTMQPSVMLLIIKITEVDVKL